jgi:hypothetical protein
MQHETNASTIRKLPFQVLTLEKKKIRSAEQYRQQVVIPSHNSSNSLPRQPQTSTQKPPQNATGNAGVKDSGYGKDIKGKSAGNYI